MAEQDTQSEEDKMAAEWAAALAESKPGNEVASEVAGPSETVAPASFASFTPTAPPNGTPGNDINMILDIPVQLTVELGRTRIPIKHIAQGEVVVVNDKFGIRLTDIVTPSERLRRLSRA